MPTRVVIAEDEAIIRLDLKETLQEEGYEVVGETGRGDEAVELVRTHQPDLAILDIKMPGLDGLSAAREITAERLAAVLILTAFSHAIPRPAPPRAHHGIRAAPAATAAVPRTRNPIIHPVAAPMAYRSVAIRSRKARS